MYICIYIHICIYKYIKYLLQRLNLSLPTAAGNLYNMGITVFLTTSDCD